MRVVKVGHEEVLLKRTGLHSVEMTGQNLSGLRNKPRYSAELIREGGFDIWFCGSESDPPAPKGVVIAALESIMRDGPPPGSREILLEEVRWLRAELALERSRVIELQERVSRLVLKAAIAIMA